MNTRKTLFAVGALGMAGMLGVAGCATAGTPSEATDLTLVTGIKASPFYESMACGATAAAGALGANLTVQAPDSWGAAGMLPVLDAVAATSPDGLLVVPTDGEALTERLLGIKESGAPIVELDQAIADASVSVSKIGSSDAQGGQLAGETMIELLAGSGKVLEISAPPGSDQQYTRAEAFSAAVAGAAGITDLGAQFSLSDVNEVAGIVTATLAAHPDLAGIFVTNDIMTIAVVTALEETGRLGEVTVVGYDASDSQIAALQAGSVAALVAQDPYGQGYTGVEQVLAAIAGDTVEAEIVVPLRVLKASDAAGIAAYLEQNSGSC